MGKKITNPIEIKLVFNVENGSIDLDASAHFGVSCEYGNLGRKGISLSHTPAQEVAIKEFGLNVWYPQIKANEEIQ